MNTTSFNFLRAIFPGIGIPGGGHIGLKPQTVATEDFLLHWIKPPPPLFPVTVYDRDKNRNMQGLIFHWAQLHSLKWLLLPTVDKCLNFGNRSFRVIVVITRKHALMLFQIKCILLVMHVTIIFSSFDRFRKKHLTLLLMRHHSSQSSVPTRADL